MPESEITVKALCQASPAYWAEFNRVKLGAATFSCKRGSGHEYQREWMDCDARRACLRKGTQMGGTEAEVLGVLHGMIHGMFPAGVMYLFPTTDSVEDFSKARFNPLIQSNPSSIGQYVKSAGKGTDTTRLKKVGDAFLYLRGARMAQRVGVDTKESDKLRSAPVDKVVFDELDLMDEQSIEKARQRMGHSEIKRERFLSNPTLPGVGIDYQFSLSDQRYWFSRCESCGKYTSADLEFPSCVKERGGKGFIACRHCGEPVNHSLGRWEPLEPSNSQYMHGYHLSQLISKFNDPLEILNDFEDPPNGNLGDVKRLRLGLPHVDAEDKLDTSVVRSCMNLDGMSVRDNGPCAMGVDMGKGKHYIIGRRISREEYQILKVGQVASLSDIHDLAHSFGVRISVVDIRPYEDEAREFQRQEPYLIFLSQYMDSWSHPPEYNVQTGIVKSDRTQMCDRSHRVFSERKIIIPRRCAAMDDFTAQCCNIAKVLETNERTGLKVFRYRFSGPRALGDHYRHALNYFLLAADRCQESKRSGGVIERPRKAISDYNLVG